MRTIKKTKKKRTKKKRKTMKKKEEKGKKRKMVIKNKSRQVEGSVWRHDEGGSEAGEAGEAGETSLEFAGWLRAVLWWRTLCLARLLASSFQ